VKITKSTFLALVLLSPMAANADLISSDLDTIGDGFLTSDTASGLEWLDVSLTNNSRSYDAMVAGIGGRDFYGEAFRHATASEIHGLLAEAGVPDVNIGWQSDNYAGATVLRGLGVLFQVPPYNLLYNDVEDPTGNPSTTRYVHNNYSTTYLGGSAWVGVGIYCNPSTSNGTCTPTNSLTLQTSFGSSSYAHLLVRSTSVPEPGTLALFGIGLFGMGLVRRKKV